MIFRRFKRVARRGAPAAPEAASRARRRRLWIAGAATWAGAAALLHGLWPAYHAPLAEGQRSSVTIVAATDFQATDIAGTELLRRQAADAAPPVFALALSRRNEALRDLGKLFDQIARLRERSAAEPERLDSAVANVLDLLGLALTPADVLALVPQSDSAAALDALREALRETWARGILLPWDRESRFQGVAPSGRIELDDGESGAPRVREIAELLTPAEAADAAAVSARSRAAYAEADVDLLRRLFATWMMPNLVYEPVLTRQRREAAERSVAPLTMTVSSGAVLVEAGERATAQTVELLRAHDRRMREKTSPHERLRRWASRAGWLALMLALSLGALHRLRPDAFDSRAKPALFSALSLLTLGAARGLLQFSIVRPLAPLAVMELALPLALAPLAGTILAGGGLGLALGLWTAAAGAVLAGQSFAVAMTGSLCAVAAVLAARRIRRRAAVFRAGVMVALTGTAAVVIAALGSQPGGLLLLRQVGAVWAGALGAAAAALLLIPFFEEVFGFTTDIRLLELTDPGHPLLQRLAAEAPGTYHHSLMVANLAQAAADAIGANALLARVCAYYHDIGKLRKPEYFAENQRQRDNPHESLAPTMSSLVILSHVKDGEELARRYRLPRPILDGIRQHHGTSLISFFYQRALARNKSGGDGKPSPPPHDADFRYPGPPPHSREMAILALADAVEAASRALDKPTPARLQRLVDDIIARKRDDGQLDHSALTFEELSRVRRALVFTLANMHHARIPYPEANESSNPQPAAHPAAGSSRDGAAGGGGDCPDATPES